MIRLPSILARDYLRNTVWPYIATAIALTLLTGVAGGLVTASDMLGW